MVTIIYRGGPDDLETIEADPGNVEYHHEHDHWIVRLGETEDGEPRVTWIPREQVHEIRGLASAFRVVT